MSEVKKTKNVATVTPKNTAVEVRDLKKRVNIDKKTPNILGGGETGFAAMEAYKLLRTNLQYSFADDMGCHTIGITSSSRGEGKSTTSINTAYTLAEAGSRVLLLECDLRLPSISTKLHLKRKPGLSEILSNRDYLENTIQKFSRQKKNGKVEIDVITSGEIPPNPSEMLGSNRMALFIKKLSQNYDYIIFDLPPVMAVSDAVIVSKLLNGVVVVVRDSYTEGNSLKETISQLKFVNAKILGFVYTFAPGFSKDYGKKYRYYG